MILKFELPGSKSRRKEVRGAVILNDDIKVSLEIGVKEEEWM